MVTPDPLVSNIVAMSSVPAATISSSVRDGESLNNSDTNPIMLLFGVMPAHFHSCPLLFSG